jgi:hypothetical protein
MKWLRLLLNKRDGVVPVAASTGEQAASPITISFAEWQKHLEEETPAELRRVGATLAWRIGIEGSFHRVELAPFVKSELNRIDRSESFSLALCQRFYDYLLADAVELENHRLFKS